MEGGSCIRRGKFGERLRDIFPLSQILLRAHKCHLHEQQSTQSATLPHDDHVGHPRPPLTTETGCVHSVSIKDLLHILTTLARLHSGGALEVRF